VRQALTAGPNSLACRRIEFSPPTGDRRGQRVRGAQRAVRLVGARGEDTHEWPGRKGVQIRTLAFSTIGSASSACGRVACTRPRMRRAKRGERLIRDAGYEPVSVGGIESACARGLRPRRVRADRPGVLPVRSTRRAV